MLEASCWQVVLGILSKWLGDVVSSREKRCCLHLLRVLRSVPPAAMCCLRLPTHTAGPSDAGNLFNCLTCFHASQGIQVIISNGRIFFFLMVEGINNNQKHSATWIIFEVHLFLFSAWNQNALGKVCPCNDKYLKSQSPKEGRGPSVLETKAGNRNPDLNTWLWLPGWVKCWVK